jgi:hypothetical protein
MEIKRVGSQPSAKGPAEYLPAPYGSTLGFRYSIQHARSAQVFGSSPVLGQHGTHTRWARLSAMVA